MDLKLWKADVGGVEAFGLRHFRSAAQLPVQPIGPAVVATAQGFRAATITLCERSCTMAANVVESADDSILAPYGDNRQAANARHHMVTNAGKLADVRE